MLEGLFSPVHLLILAVVVFLVIGPRKLVSGWQRTGQQLRTLGNEDRVDGETAPPQTPEPTGRVAAFARRLGRLARRSHSRRQR